MAVKIRLARYGKKKKPFYRIMVAKDTAPRNGRFIEQIGTYDPCSEPPITNIDKDRAVQWIKKGAQPTPAVIQILKKGGVYQKASSPSL